MTHATQTIPGRLTVRHLIAAALIAVTTAVVTVAVVRLVDEEPSLTTRVDGRASVATPALYAPADLTLYARSRGLAGLSPASLAPADAAPADAATVTGSDLIAVYDVYREVARYAQANGLSGLSPASLAPASGGP